MNNTAKRIALELGTLLLTAALAPHAWAQLAHSAAYDSVRRVSLEGPVTRIDWANPNAFIFVDVEDEAGTVANWAVEVGNPLNLERAGWNRNSVKIGDAVTVEGMPARGARNVALASSVMRNGQAVFTPFVDTPTGASPAAPRWPDGRVRLGPAPGGTGYWGPASAVALVENGQQVAMNADAILENISDAGRVAPFQPWAKGVYEYRQRTLLADDPYARCVPPAGPRQFHTPHGFQFVEQPELGRILVLLGGGDRNWRVIYTDGRPEMQPEDVSLSFYGTSVGHWEGDTLVVDTVGFNESFWFSQGGLPHTERLHLVERFTRSDRDTLQYQVTVDDPGAYTRSWTGGWTIRWVADREIEEFFCEDNAESTFIR